MDVKDIKKSLKEQFPKINKIYFEDELGISFLRIEVALKKMAEVEEISRQINEYLDAYPTIKDIYYLDIFSSGSDLTFSFEEAPEKIGTKIQLIKDDQNEYVGKILAVNENELILGINLKGRIKKLTFSKETITKLAIHI